jgi:hypothetical protein
MTQQGLFDRSRRNRDRSMAQVEAHTPDGWAAAARSVIIDLSNRLPGFTSDDIWATGLPKTREPRALGPVLARLAREGVIVPVGYQQTRQASRNAAPVRVWRKA